MSNPDEQFADDVLSGMLASIDHPTPLLRAHDVIRRARTRTKRRSVLLAAAAVLAVSGVAAAAVPNSFLHRYLERLSAHRSATPAAVAAAPTVSDAASRGIAFAPGAQLDVDFRAEQASGALEVRWAETPLVHLSQTGASGDAHYALTPGGVIVDNGGSTASYSLVLPRTLARAHVRVAGRVVLSKDGETVSCVGVRADSGTCVIVIGVVR